MSVKLAVLLLNSAWVAGTLMSGRPLGTRPMQENCLLLI